ncbi:E3 ubiquitin-protein ligase synoviolin A isoform X2 [Hyalella azteca]|uniref:RING-type E3 ubiquitin transferase n=1 Tax=Hyalella azteca TaxID=294128 RepID=A0A8B7PGY7_HYAAZ|nr:E3 ubiquitin-protein ligase synoviolin A isoform X2 [Hyalella azteca]
MMPTTIPMGGLGLTLLSTCLTAGVIANAYYQKKQFYPSVVYIMKSNPSIVALYLMAFTLALLLGKLLKKIFFGTLRAAESEHLIERFFYAITETCLAFTVFRDDFSHKFVALFTVLLFLKSFHWLADYRVDYMERSPIITRLFHIRIASLLALLSTIDILLVRHAYYSTMSMGASVQLVFGFEYAILLTVAYNIGVKYICHGIDLHRENPWENKAMYLLYTELFVGLIKVMLYVVFLIIMVRIHTFPLFIIRPMYLTMKSFKKALQDTLQSRLAIHNMNTLYPDATAEELQQADNVCIICREEMIVNSGVKKLPCNHLFHALCLRSWFQRQQTCPTCRLDVLRPTPAPARPAAPAAPPQQQMPAQGAPANMVEFFQQVAEHQERARQRLAAAAASSRNLQATPAGAADQQANPAARGEALPPVPPPLPFPMMGAPFPGFLPPPFPPFPIVPPHLVQQPQQQPGPSSSGTSTSTPVTPATASTSTASSSASAVPGAAAAASPAFLPPFPGMSPADFGPLTLEELVALEGRERRHVEARLKALSNINVLVHAALVQMTQYQQLMTRLDLEYPLPPPPPPPAATTTATQVTTSAPSTATSTATTTSTASTATTTPTVTTASTAGATDAPSASTSAAADSSQTSSVSSTPINSAVSSPSSDSDVGTPEEIRRRRLERFASGSGN